MAGPRRGAPPPRAPLHRPAARAQAARRGAPGARLPLHVLLVPTRPARGVAPRAGGRAARRRGVPRAGPATSRTSAACASTRAALPRLAPTARFVRTLLTATAARPARLSCFGLHEWAMVYRSPRPGTPPCRSGWAPRAPTRSSRPCPCTAPTTTRSGSSPRRARPRNAVAPGARRPGGARAARLPARHHGSLQVGLQARPRHPGRPGGRRASSSRPTSASSTCGPAPTTSPRSATRRCPSRPPAGRAAYARAQANFALRAAPLRERLVDVCTALL